MLKLNSQCLLHLENELGSISCLVFSCKYYVNLTSLEKNLGNWNKMGAVFGIPLACGHRESPDQVKKNVAQWQIINNNLSEVDSEKSFRKYSLAELTKLNESAIELALKLRSIYQDLTLGEENFQKSVEVMKVIRMTHKVIEESTYLIGN